MLKNIRIFTSDPLWGQILGDLGATCCPSPDMADVDLDALGLDAAVSMMELKAAIFQAMDNRPMLRQIFGKDVRLSGGQTRLVTLLYKSGGMRMAELRQAMGYAPGATTHTIDTLISQLRRLFGREFIINDGGVYRIGKL